jgi:hypothetical protein
MQIKSILVSIFKNIVAGLTLYGIGVAMAHGAYIETDSLCDPRFCCPPAYNNESE